MHRTTSNSANECFILISERNFKQRTIVCWVNSLAAKISTNSGTDFRFPNGRHTDRETWFRRNLFTSIIYQRVFIRLIRFCCFRWNRRLKCLQRDTSDANFVRFTKVLTIRMHASSPLHISTSMPYILSYVPIFEFYYKFFFSSFFWIYWQTHTSLLLTIFSLWTIKHVECVCLCVCIGVLTRAIFYLLFFFFVFFEYIFDAHIHIHTCKSQLATQQNILFVSISMHCVYINSDNRTE